MNGHTPGPLVIVPPMEGTPVDALAWCVATPDGRPVAWNLRRADAEHMVATWGAAPDALDIARLLLLEE